MRDRARSPDAAERNPGRHRRLAVIPDYAPLHPGYALHPPLQGEGRPPQAGGVGCSAPPLARAPVNAVTPPAALRASTSPSRGGGEISSPPSSNKNACCGNESFSSEIRFAPVGHGRPRKFNGSHTRNARFSVASGRASTQFRCCLTRLSHPLPGASSRPP